VDEYVRQQAIEFSGYPGGAGLTAGAVFGRAAGYGAARVS